MLRRVMMNEFSPDVVSLILQRVQTADLVSISQVNSLWRAAARDSSQLRCWSYDDDLPDVVGLKASVTPMKPKTPLPKHWVNPTEFSPLAHFKTPSSLQSRTPLLPLVQRTQFFENADAGCSSPRTPSPIQQRLDVEVPFSQIIRRNTEGIGRFFGDVDVSSSRLSDQNVQIILRNCPNLHTIRLQHVCGGKRYMRVKPLPSPFEAHQACEDGALDQENAGHTTCGCGQLTERAFESVSSWCPNLTSVTLVLQHVSYRRALRSIMAQLGALLKLHTLAIELRMPSFGMSVKSEYMWLDHTRCSDSEIYALINAGPPPLQALGLNRCDLSDECISAIASAFPKLEAVELHCPVFENLGWNGISPSVGERLKGLKNLTAAAIGLISNISLCSFSTWTLPALRRLRLETVERLSSHHLFLFLDACAKLESLHLLWTGEKGILREAHIYPVTRETIMEYVSSF